MDEKILIEGRKTFFVAPDTSLLPESYLEDYMARGYETYIVDDFRFCPVDKKVAIIRETFPDSIFFFFIDTDVGVIWEKYIQELQNEDPEILIGVLYTKRKGEAERRAMEKYYLFDVGIQCGCIALEFQKQRNFGLIDRVMYANQACGRRKNVRALCDLTSKANFDYQKTVINGHVIDISLSHFSFTPDPNTTYPELEDNAKLENVFISFNGIHFRTNAQLMMKRPLVGKTLYIFLFIKPNGAPGLSGDLVTRVSQKIYTSVTDKVKALMRSKFDAYAKANSNKPRPIMY